MYTSFVCFLSLWHVFYLLNAIPSNFKLVTLKPQSFSFYLHHNRIVTSKWDNAFIKALLTGKKEHMLRNWKGNDKESLHWLWSSKGYESMLIDGQPPFRASHDDIFNMDPWIELRSLCLQESTFLCPLDFIVFRVFLPLSLIYCICFEMGTTGWTFYYTWIRSILSYYGIETSRNLLRVQM